MKSKIIKCFIAILFTISIKAQPPNNAIFFGGVGDGFVNTANVASSNSIFLGGIGDGGNVASNGAASNNIFVGSIGDGFNFASNNAVSNAIFIGGIGDGFSNAGNAAVSNSIFTGSEGDGWHFAANASSSNNIFLGGVGDGWSSVYLPLAPLPVQFLYFNAIKQSKTVALLEWKTAQEINTVYYDVIRSTDAINFSFIGKVKASGNTNNVVTYNFIDNAPAKGLNYYRLKQADKDGRFTYTPIRVLKFDELDAGLVKYYPNPTNGILNMELTEAIKNEAKVITISNALGMVVSQLRLPANGNIIIPINFSKYAKGIYFIQLQTPNSNSTQRIVLQ